MAPVVVKVEGSGPTQENFIISLFTLLADKNEEEKEAIRKLFADLTVRLSKARGISYSVDNKPDYSHEIEIRF